MVMRMVVCLEQLICEEQNWAIGGHPKTCFYTLPKLAGNVSFGFPEISRFGETRSFKPNNSAKWPLDGATFEATRRVFFGEDRENMMPKLCHLSDEHLLWSHEGFGTSRWELENVHLEPFAGLITDCKARGRLCFYAPNGSVI